MLLKIAIVCFGANTFVGNGIWLAQGILFLAHIYIERESSVGNVYIMLLPSHPQWHCLQSSASLDWCAPCRINRGARMCVTTTGHKRGCFPWAWLPAASWKVISLIGKMEALPETFCQIWWLGLTTADPTHLKTPKGSWDKNLMPLLSNHLNLFLCRYGSLQNYISPGFLSHLWNSNLWIKLGR